MIVKVLQIHVQINRRTPGETHTSQHHDFASFGPAVVNKQRRRNGEFFAAEQHVMFDKRQRSKQSHTSKGLFCQEIRRPEHKTEEKPSAPVVCVGFSITRVIVVGFDSMRGFFFCGCVTSTDCAQGGRKCESCWQCVQRHLYPQVIVRCHLCLQSRVYQFVRRMILFILYWWRQDERSDRISTRLFVFLIAVTKAK